eukprot:GILJ01007244.1.p1 GENE.GILJ01007244.1~~GILJ01007244.1.p1  ORF type:complete len:519 (-),score=100.02 GILJ01007244.1:156-1658(-)
MDKTEMKRWSADHIRIWGRHVALNDAIINKFYENDVNGSRLFSLDAGKLKKMGLTNAEDRDKVLSEISRLHLLGPSLKLQKEIDDSKLSLTRLAVDTTNNVTSRLNRVADGISKSVAFLKRFSKPKDKEKNSEKTSLSSPPSFSSSSSVLYSVSTATETQTQSQSQQSVFSSSSSMVSHHSQSFIVTASSQQTKTYSQKVAEKFRRTVSGDLLKHELPNKSIHLRAQYAAAHGDPSKLSQAERRTTELMRAALTHEDSFKNSLLDSQIDSENGDNDEFLLPTNTAIYIPPFSVLHHVFQHNESIHNPIHEPTWHGALHRVMKGQYDLDEIERQLQETVTVRVAKRRSTVGTGSGTGYRMQRAHNNSLDPSVCRKPSTPVISADDLPVESIPSSDHKAAGDSTVTGSCSGSIQPSDKQIADNHVCASPPAQQPLNGLTSVTLSPDLRSDSSTQVESSPSIDGSVKSQHVVKRLSATFDDLDQFYDTEQLEHSIAEVEEIEI